MFQSELRHPSIDFFIFLFVAGETVLKSDQTAINEETQLLIAEFANC